MKNIISGTLFLLAPLSLAGSTLAIQGEPNGISALVTPRETVLHAFAGRRDGSFPNAALIADAQGALYGTTANGGDGLSQGAGYGTIFKLTPPAPGKTEWVRKVLYRFRGLSDGSFPYAGLIMDEHGALYGTTESDGSSGINGTVFKLTPSSDDTEWTETVLYAFHGSDGSAPVAGLIRDKHGALYGTTSSGGLGFGFGAAFKLTPPARGETAWTETVLHLFTGGIDGDYPFAGLTAGPDGALYGTTSNGGGGNNGGYGTVFKLTPPAWGEPAWTETVLYSFTGGSDGSIPQAGVIFDNEGALYGTTTLGGAGSSGTVFKLTPPAKGGTTWTETVLYSFSGGSDGNSPASGLIADARGALYGTTAGGGANGVGAVFKLAPPTSRGALWGESVLYSFKGGSDGSYPYAGVIGDWQGNLYGTTSGTDGLPGDFGTVFELSLCARTKHTETNAPTCPAFP